MKPIPAYLLLSAALVPAMAKADTSATFGMVSDYIFRGFFQEDSTGYVGFNYSAESGFYAGTWFGEVGKGIEYDALVGYGGKAGELGWDVSYGRYMYTNEFDDTYHEVKLDLSHSGFTLSLINGEYGNFGDALDYSFVSLNYAFDNGIYATFGSWGRDFDGSFLEVGYGFDFNGLDLSVSVVSSDDLPVSQEPFTDGGMRFNVVFGISKSVSFGN